MRRDVEGMTDERRGAWTAVGLWLVLQLTLTSLPGKDIPISLPHPIDWIGHFGLYFGLGALITRAASIRGWPARRLVWVALALSALGALDELHQLFIPGRDCQLSDWIVDTLGGSLGVFVGSRVMASRLGQWLR